MKKIVVLMSLFLSFSWANDYNYSEEQLTTLKAQALERAQALMMQEIFNLTNLYELGLWGNNLTGEISPNINKRM